MQKLPLLVLSQKASQVALPVVVVLAPEDDGDVVVILVETVVVVVRVDAVDVIGSSHEQGISVP